MLNGSINIKINFKWYAFSKMCMQMCVTIFLFFVIVIGRKGGHKGRMRNTSPEEIDAQMKAEKERKKVGKGIGDKGQLCFCNFLTMYYVQNILNYTTSDFTIEKWEMEKWIPGWHISGAHIFGLITMSYFVCFGAWLSVL